MIWKGDCLACTLLPECTRTSVEKVLRGFTCTVFEPAPEPVYLARWHLMKQYGEDAAVQGMVLQQPQVNSGES